MNEKSVTLNLNGVDINEVVDRKPPRRNFIHDYQGLLGALVVAAAILAHAWWIGRVSRPMSFSMPITVHPQKTEVRTVPVPCPAAQPTPPTKSPLDGRIVEEVSPSR